jgi:hypothetical protein
MGLPLLTHPLFVLDEHEREALWRAAVRPELEATAAVAHMLKSESE